MNEFPKTISTHIILDDRGHNAILYDAEVASQLPDDFHIVQINQALSTRVHTLRGLHHQLEPYAQAKLCYVLSGSVYNVALNLETGEVHTAVLKPGTAMFIPRGYAHGYLTLEDNVLFQWCVDNDFAPDFARVLRYDSCGIGWPLDDWSKVIISDKDRNAGKWLG